MNMTKVESVSVDQSILGRMLDYGDITVRGTGAGLSPLRMIQNPLALAVLEGRFGEGDAIVVRPDGKGGLDFSSEPARETIGA